MQPASASDSSTHFPERTLLDKLFEAEQAIHELNKKMSKGKDPNDIPARIREINNAVQAVRDELKQSEPKTLGMSADRWQQMGWASVLSSIIIQLSQSAVNIPLLFTNGTVLNIPVLVSVVSLTTLGVVAGAIMGIYGYGRQKMDGKQNLHDQKVAHQEMLVQFFQAYEKFIHPQTKQDQKQDEELKNCVELLKEISKAQVLPSDARDRWISALLNELPSDNPLKVKFLAQHQMAVKQNMVVVDDSDSLQQSTFLNEKNADRATHKASLGFASAYQNNFSELQKELGIPFKILSYQGLDFDYDLNVTQIRKKKKDVEVIIEK